MEAKSMYIFVMKNHFFGFKI